MPNDSDKKVTWDKDIKDMLAIGVVQDMKKEGYDLSDYISVKNYYDLYLLQMENGKMPPGVRAYEIAFLEQWIDDGCPDGDRFIKVIDILDRSVGGAGEDERINRSPHGAFWRGINRMDFIGLQIPGSGEELPLLVMGDGANSNLVKALKGESPFGSDIDTSGAKYRRMPAGLWWTEDQRQKNVERFKQWKTDGFLKEQNSGGHMGRYTQVIGILDNSIGGPDVQIGRHGAFWRNMDRDEFVEEASIFGVKLITLSDGAGSGLVKALKGEDPFGSDIGTSGATNRRMPAGRDPVPDQDIEFIKQWIDDGCPN